MDDLLELDERILTVAIPDEVLERAATAEQQAVTWAYCTNAWHYWSGRNKVGFSLLIQQRAGLSTPRA